MKTSILAICLIPLFVFSCQKDTEKIIHTTFVIDPISKTISSALVSPGISFFQYEPEDRLFSFESQGLVILDYSNPVVIAIRDNGYGGTYQEECGAVVKSSIEKRSTCIFNFEVDEDFVGCLDGTGFKIHFSLEVGVE